MKTSERLADALGYAVMLVATFVAVAMAFALFAM